MRMQKPVAVRDKYLERVIHELDELRIEENRLIRFYRRVRRTPMLRMRFMMDLADLHARVDRLDAILDPNQSQQVEQLCA